MTATKTRVLIAGGGIAALEALLVLRADARELTDVTLVADTDTFVYRSQQVGEAFGVAPARRHDLGALVADAGATFVRDRVAKVDAGGRELLLASGATLSFDALLLALGTRSVPAFDHGTTFGPAS